MMNIMKTCLVVATVALGACGNLLTDTPDRKTPIVAPEPVLDDSDRDGIPDTVDECPRTPAGSRVDERGCKRMNNVGENREANG